MSPSIKVRRLSLQGTGRTYDVSFLTEDGRVRPLSIVSGEISTGKSSILQFIDYCLGGRDHPKHPEIERKVSAARIEIEINDEIVVIRRPLFNRARVTLHHCSLEGLLEYHDVTDLVITPAGAEDSLSTFLLRGIGLGGVSLKQAPTQEASKTDPLSFRDFGDLLHLPHRRLDNEELVYERHPPKMHKLRQAIDVVFGAHDQALVDANAALDAERTSIARINLEIDTITTFLAEQGLDEGANLSAIEREAVGVLDSAYEELQALEERMESATSAADQVRASYREATDSVSRLARNLRDRQTLEGRLGALRAQYADDLSKLRFAAEAQRLFDPLSLTMCPSCLQPLTAPAGPANDHCGLCAQVIDLNEPDAFDVGKELRDTETKLRELGSTVDDVERDIERFSLELGEAEDVALVARRDLDEAVSARLAPFIADRDVMQSRVVTAEQAVSEVRRSRSLVAGVESRREAVAKHRTEEERLQRRIGRIEQQGQNHAAVVASLSRRFASLLAEFDFPKLTEPRIDDRFVPHVRGMKYSDLGSGGAITLVSLAWHLAILQEAIAQEGNHPGLLMIDSPQKNLFSDRDLDAPAKADAFYRHLVAWSATDGADAQVIMVDNSPRDLGLPHVVVDYSGDPERPPYGLIDDEAG